MSGAEQATALFGSSLYRRAAGVPPVVIHAYPKRRLSRRFDEVTLSEPAGQSSRTGQSSRELTYADFLGESLHAEVALAS